MAAGLLHVAAPFAPQGNPYGLRDESLHDNRRALRQAQGEEICSGVGADGIGKTPHAELVEAPMPLIQAYYQILI
jgi:hypothetical protein